MGHSVSSARKLAVDAIYQVMEKGAFSNLALLKILSASSLSLPDKRLSTEIFNGTIRMIKRLDWVLNLFLQKKMEKQNPWVRNILRMSLYQLMFMDKVPDYAVVHDAVEMTRTKTNQTMSRLVNAVLRNIIRESEKIKYPEGQTEYLAVFYSHPEWMVKMFLDRFGYDQTIQLLQYNNCPAPVVLRCNFLQMARHELIRHLKAENISCQPSITPWGVVVQDLSAPLSETGPFRQGAFYIQNEASMLAAAILHPNPNRHVYDLCCGVGGKTTHIAEFMKNSGKIDAFDLYESKISLLKDNCRRLGINIVNPVGRDVLALDVTRYTPSDYVVLDAPCSGLGVLNRRADLRWRKEPEDIRDLSRLQAGLLEKAAQLVKPGGGLLYATCTIQADENEGVIQHFINKSDFRLEPFADRIKFFPLDESDRKKAASGMLTIMPGKYGTDGMFYALMRRTTSTI